VVTGSLRIIHTVAGAPGYLNEIFVVAIEYLLERIVATVVR
jgi:hypothetical protein